MSPRDIPPDDYLASFAPALARPVPPVEAKPAAAIETKPAGPVEAKPAGPVEAKPAGLIETKRAMPATSLLVAMTAIGPFSMQILLPTLPAMAVAMAVPYGTVQLTLTLYLIGVAVGQLIYGPLSDRFGRKPLLLGGLGLYLLGSVGAVLAPSIEFLIAARVLQALGGCAGLVLGRAMVRDSYPRERSAAVLGTVSTAMAVAPMIAPLLGSMLEAEFGWRAPLLACLLAGLPLLLAVWARLPETLAQPAPLPGLAGLLGAYVQLIRLPAFRAYAAVTAFSTCVFFAFAAGGPLVVIERMGHAPTVYGAALMSISVGWMSGTFMVSRLVHRLGVTRMLHLGTAVTMAGGATAVLAELLLADHIALFFLPMMIVAVGNGMTQPNAIAAAVSVRPQLAGTASGLVGALQMASGALMTVAAGTMETGSGLATAVWMCLGGVGAVLALIAVRRAVRAR